MNYTCIIRRNRADDETFIIKIKIIYILSDITECMTKHSGCFDIGINFTIYCSYINLMYIIRCEHYDSYFYFLHYLSNSHIKHPAFNLKSLTND